METKLVDIIKKMQHTEGAHIKRIKISCKYTLFKLFIETTSPNPEKVEKEKVPRKIMDLLFKVKNQVTYDNLSQPETLQALPQRQTQLDSPMKKISGSDVLNQTMHIEPNYERTKYFYRMIVTDPHIKT